MADEIRRGIRSTAALVALAALILLTFGAMFLITRFFQMPKGSLEIVPCSHDLEAVANASYPFMRKRLGVASADPNLWGVALMGDEELEGYVRIRCTAKGPVRVEVNLKPSGVKRPVEVLAYPSVIYGRKPWDNPAEHLEVSDLLPLPLRLSELPRITLYAEYTVREGTRYNIAYDLWLVREPSGSGAGPGDVEVMVWLSWRDCSPAGYLAKVVEIPAVVNGTPQTLKWNVWVHPRVGAGWAYVAFLPQRPVERGAVALNLSNFIQYTLITLSELQPGRWSTAYFNDLYLASIELGSEVFYSDHATLVWELWRYSIHTGS